MAESTSVVPAAEQLEKLQKELQEKVQSAAKEVNEVLEKYGLEFQVTHKIVVNPDLKQEEIFHDILLRLKRTK